jgi:hypothetical protein
MRFPAFQVSLQNEGCFQKIILLQQRLGDHGVALFQDHIDIIAVFVQRGEDEDENPSGFLAAL